MLLQDIRFAIRQLRRAPGFAIAAGVDAGAGHRRELRDFLPDGRALAASHAGSACGRSGSRVCHDDAEPVGHVHL